MAEGKKGKAHGDGLRSPTVDLSAAAVLLARLKAVGVDYIFANSGTDFPPIIEGLLAAGAAGFELPEALIMPHESAAMGMAHGFYLATGRAQAVMAHTNVGLANCAIGAINAATDHVPILLFSGRTPTTEAGRFGCRTVPIGWGQEMRDQTALVREVTKWDTELRYPEQVPGMVDRAMAIACSAPRGPVYMSLPREVLCEPCPTDGLDVAPTMAPIRSAPPPDLIRQAAELIAEAKSPMIIAQRGPGSPEAFAALTRLAEMWGLPVSHYWANRISIPTMSPMCAGSDPMPWLAQADVVLVLDALAPWSPDIHHLRADVKIIQAGPDPLFSATPVRDFRSHISLGGETSDIVLALCDALGELAGDHKLRNQARAERVALQISATRAKAQSALAPPAGGKPTKAWVSHCLSKAIAGLDAAVLSELGAPLDPIDLKVHNSWFQEPHSGGLGWSFPCAMGMQLARPDKLVIATMGDGSYMFANPVACHQIAEAYALPVLVIVLNNAEWGAVRQSVTGLYPQGYAASANAIPLTALSPSPDFTKVAEASRAWTARVTEAEVLPEILADAIAHVRTKRTQALVEVAVAPQ